MSYVLVTVLWDNRNTNGAGNSYFKLAGKNKRAYGSGRSWGSWPPECPLEGYGPVV